MTFLLNPQVLYTNRISKIFYENNFLISYLANIDYDYIDAGMEEIYGKKYKKKDLENEINFDLSDIDTLYFKGNPNLIPGIDEASDIDEGSEYDILMLFPNQLRKMVLIQHLEFIFIMIFKLYFENYDVTGNELEGGMTIYQKLLDDSARSCYD